jgi:hypothetical protein
VTKPEATTYIRVNFSCSKRRVLFDTSSVVVYEDGERILAFTRAIARSYGLTELVDGAIG